MRVDVAIIGGQKCGTTTLFHALARHPGINPARAKESRAFLLDDRARDAALASLFERAPGKALHAYAHAWSKPQALTSMHRHNPAMRLVALTRDPVDRVWSAYQFARRNGWEPLSLVDALAAEPARRQGDHIARTELQYIANSRYDALIRSVAEVFPADQLLVLPLDRLGAADDAALAEIVAHVGLEPADLPPLAPRNTHAAARIPALHRIALGESWPKRVVRRTLPPWLKQRVHRAVVAPLLRANTAHRPPVPMTAKDRMHIEHYLAEAS